VRPEDPKRQRNRDSYRANGCKTIKDPKLHVALSKERNNEAGEPHLERRLIIVRGSIQRQSEPRPRIDTLLNHSSVSHLIAVSHRFHTDVMDAQQVCKDPYQSISKCEY
jgi:hypothetical protein